MIHELIEGWDGMGVVTSHDADTGTWFFIALHDTTLGPAVGGTRMKVYDSPDDGLRDAMRLGEGMTYKWAGVGIEFGGGKGVIALSRPLSDGERAAVLKRYGRLIASLRGSFQTGQDLGTTPEDMVAIAREAKFVHGIDREAWTALDPGPYTALGVFVGIRAAVKHVFGSDDLTGKSVLIQGAGDVGAPLARQLRDAGAKVLVTDIDSAREEALAQEVDGPVVDPAQVYETPCDVYAPCAIGATVNAETIPLLACRIVAGSANNQLAEAEDAARLHARGILYAPDYIINGGGAAAFGMMAHGTTDDTALFARCEQIGEVLAEIFDEAAERDESPLNAARRRVDRVLRVEIGD